MGFDNYLKERVTSFILQFPVELFSAQQQRSFPWASPRNTHKWHPNLWFYCWFSLLAYYAICPYSVIIPHQNGASNSGHFDLTVKLLKLCYLAMLGYLLREFWLDLGNICDHISWHHDTFIFVGEYELHYYKSTAIYAEGDFLVKDACVMQ